LLGATIRLKFVHNVSRSFLAETECRLTPGEVHDAAT
jgi:hypothetical protein